MQGVDGAELAFVALALILPLSALAARRLPWRQVLGLVLVWGGIFAVGLIGVGLGRDGLQPLAERALRILRGQDDQQVSGGTVRIRMAADGHFWATVDVDGVQRRMLIDSGATTTALSLPTAQAAGLDLAESPFPALLTTANGTVAARMATVDLARLGPIEARRLRVVVSEAFGDTDVLGMNFLSGLRSWRVEGRTLILEAAP